nr:Alt-1 protein [Haemonchus contortus]
MLRVLLISAFILAVCNGQMIKQCTCEQLAPCMNVNADTFFKCGQQCQRHATDLNFSYGSASQCFEQIRGQMDRAIQCYNKFMEQGCARGAPQMVPKRYGETLKLALYNRISNMMDRTGVRQELMDFFKSSQKFSGCQFKCVGKSATSCKTKNNCGIAEPPDNVIVDNMIQCAIQSGIDTPTIQKLCHCITQAGNQHLEAVCDRLVMP